MYIYSTYLQVETPEVFLVGAQSNTFSGFGHFTNPRVRRGRRKGGGVGEREENRV
jgi:hypothetical protein